MDQIKVGAFFKVLRKEKNLTQEQLAEQLGVSGRTVSRWETGNRFYLESAIITTPASMRSFNYHDKEKVLRHENRRPVHDDMGGYVKSHEQFRRKASWKEVIDYIYRHDQWRLQKAAQEERL